MRALLTAERPIAIRRLAAGVDRRLQRMSGLIGRVHSVFERAMNVRCGDGRLVMLQGPGLLAAPFAIALDRALPGWKRIAPGTAVVRSGSELRIGGIRIESRGAAAAPTTIEPGAEPTVLASALLNGDAPPTAPALRNRAALAARDALARGVSTGHVDALLAGAIPLIGLGEGLTPAGDDCVVGVLAVVHRFRPDLVRDQPAIARTISAAAETRTTSIGREFLLHAVCGSFSEPVIAVVTAATAGRARAAIRGLLATGATSGADTVSGMRLAISALRS